MVAVSTFTGMASILLLYGAVIGRLHPLNLISHCCLGGAFAGAGYKHGGTIKVSSALALSNALASAKAGDVIVMAAGDYGNVTISNRNYSGTVTVLSASSTDWAHLDRLAVHNVTNLLFKKIDIGGVRLSTEKSTYLVNVGNSTSITFDGVFIHGLVDGDFSHDLGGLSVRSSNSIRVINSEFKELRRGAWVQRSKDVQLVGNNLQDIRMDGIALAAVTKVMIDGNRFTNFQRLKQDHSDAIQFWTTNERTASTDITIRNNQILQGNGTAMQGIFMRDESGKLPYERVLIENNLVYESGYANGITVIGGKTITMKGNTVISMTGDTTTTKIRIEDVSGAVIIRNVTDMFAELGTNSDIVFQDNITLSKSPSTAKKLSEIGFGASATAPGLVIKGSGYQPPALSKQPPISSNGSKRPPAHLSVPVAVP